MKVVSILTASTLFVAGAAVAQDTAPPAADTQPATEAAEPAPATPASESAATPAPVTDAEVDLFALAAKKVQDIAGDETLDQTAKQAAMATAVQETGLDPQRFNEIATAIQTDQALNERVQLAAVKHAQPTELAEPSPEPTEDPTEEPSPQMSE